MNVVAHNLLAMNSTRQNGLVTTSKKKVTEKLSSGYKINRAADDAAGLAISEKMRRQIKGLTRASENAQDGISLVQVADGALSEMHDILHRINILSVQSSNDTNTREDREYLQQEVEQLGSEINRISKNTSFNEIYLFDMPPLVAINSSDYSNAKFDEKATIGNDTYTHTKAMDFSMINANNVSELEGKSFSVKCSQGCNQLFTFSFSDSSPDDIKLVNNPSASRPSLNVTIDINTHKTGADIANTIYNLAKSEEANIIAAAATSGTMPTGSANAARIGHCNGLAYDGSKLTFFAVDNSSSGKIMASELDGGSRTLDLQVGAEQYQIIGVNLYKINSSTLGIGDIDISTQDGASKAITSVKGGLEKISHYRAYYGATQNRLEHTIKNLDNVVENTTAAESQIRDTDMAKSMVEFSNLNILDQAGISMMSQANQSKQTILSLLG